MREKESFCLKFWSVRLQNPTSQIRKFIDFTSHRYFYPKNDRVGKKNEALKTDGNINFSLNSVNGGHRFSSKKNYDFLKYKHHPNKDAWRSFREPCKKL